MFVFQMESVRLGSSRLVSARLSSACNVKETIVYTGL